MLFTYYTVIFANVFFINTDSSTPNDGEVTVTDTSISNSEIRQINNTDIKSNFKLKQMNISNNLKSNFFDKMLSNEMLSMKQQIYEKDSSYGSTVYLTFKHSVQTPTLEIKQKWLLKKSQVKEENHIMLENITSLPFGNNNIIIKPRKKGVEHEKRNLADLKRKVIDERSFPSFHISTMHNLLKSAHPRHCNCNRSDMKNTCTYNSVKTCTYTSPDCTRKSEISPISVAHYTYYGYFVGLTTDYYQNAYYYPNIVYDYTTQTKRRKTKNPYDSDSYLEERDEYAEYEADYEPNKLNDRYPGRTVIIDSIKHNDKAVTLLQKISKGYLGIVNQDEFVSDIVEDFKNYHSDVIIKDCYCSSFKKSKFIFFHFIFIGIYYVILCFVNSI